MARLLRANFPSITQTGIYNDRNIAGTNRRSAHAEGRALDVHLNAAEPNERLLADQLAAALVRKAGRLGIDNVIWNRRIWSVAHPRWRPYSGASPHTDHIHIEFTRTGSQGADVRAIEVEVAIIRTGLEELAQSRANIG